MMVFPRSMTRQIHRKRYVYVTFYFSENAAHGLTGKCFKRTARAFNPERSKKKKKKRRVIYFVGHNRKYKLKTGKDFRDVRVEF